MNRRIKTSSKPLPSVRTTSRRAPSVDRKTVAKALGVEDLSETDAELRGSPSSLFALRQELYERLRSTGGCRSLKGATAEMDEKYTKFYEGNRQRARKLESEGITEEFLCPKIAKWFDESGQWVENYGLSLVTFIPEGTLKNRLINAQEQIATFFNDQGSENAWIPIKADRFHMTIRPVDVNNITQNSPRTNPIFNDKLQAHISNLEPKICQIGNPFKVSFERVFQSPGDGRLGVEGIPASFEDYKAIMKLRTMKLPDLPPYEVFMVHIAIGTIRQPMTFRQVQSLHTKIGQINGQGKFGALYADTAYLVHHSNDHFAGQAGRSIVQSFPL